MRGLSPSWQVSQEETLGGVPNSLQGSLEGLVLASLWSWATDTGRMLQRQSQ